MEPLRVRQERHHKRQQPTNKQVPLRVRHEQHYKHNNKKRILSPIRKKRENRENHDLPETLRIQRKMKEDRAQDSNPRKSTTQKMG